MTAAANPFVWYELMTSDTKAAESFYGLVVGWTMQDAGVPAGPYTLLKAGSTAAAGLMALPAEACAQGARPGWIGYIGVADVDTAAASIQKAGGSVLRAPADIPGVGRFAVAADPHGAAFCIFKGNLDEQPPQPPAGTPGTVGWNELHAGDLDSAWAFYSSQFGWTKDQGMDMGPLGVYQIFCTGAQPVGGMMTKMAEVPMPYWNFYFNVDAIDAAALRITAAGGKVINGPMQVPGGSWIVNGIDPQGAVFALVAPKR